jgi:hypothetical protein
VKKIFRLALPTRGPEPQPAVAEPEPELALAA